MEALAGKVEKLLLKNWVKVRTIDPKHVADATWAAESEYISINSSRPRQHETCVVSREMETQTNAIGARLLFSGGCFSMLIYDAIQLD